MQMNSTESLSRATDLMAIVFLLETVDKQQVGCLFKIIFTNWAENSFFLPFTLVGWFIIVWLIGVSRCFYYWAVYIGMLKYKFYFSSAPMFILINTISILANFVSNDYFDHPSMDMCCCNVRVVTSWALLGLPTYVWRGLAGKSLA